MPHIDFASPTREVELRNDCRRMKQLHQYRKLTICVPAQELQRATSILEAFKIVQEFTWELWNQAHAQLDGYGEGNGGVLLRLVAQNTFPVSHSSSKLLFTSAQTRFRVLSFVVS